MKREIVILIIFAAMIYKVFAYDFSAVSPSGHVLYYNVLSNESVELTYNCYDESHHVGYYSPSLTGSLVIPDSVSYNGQLFEVSIIGDFALCQNELLSISIPNTVNSIGQWAFWGCNGLTDIIIPNSVTSIGHEAFLSCEELATITIPKSVNFIGGRVFAECYGLVTLNYNADSIESFPINNGTQYHPFFGCPISTVNIGNNVKVIPSDFCSPFRGYVESVTIGDSVTSIGSSAFMGCRKINSITIPSTVSYIGYNAFKDCSGLTTINFNARNCSTTSRYSLSDGIFHGCNNISRVNFGDSVIIIPAYLLHHCVGLDSVTIGNSVTIIGDSAFLGCTRLANINYTGTIAQWCGISFGIASNPVQYTHKLCINNMEITNLVIPQGVSEIKSRAFLGCRGLTCVEVPNSSSSIGVSAFSGCDHITNIMLGTGLSVIGNNAFWGCTQVVRIVSKATNPPVVQSSTFSSLSDDVILNVPCDAANAYENAAYWFRFNIQEELVYDFSATSSNPARGTVTVVTEPTCDYREAQVQANAYHGYHFDHWSDGNTDNPRYIVVLQDTHLVAYFASDNGEDEGIEETAEEGIKLYQRNGQIVVEGAEGSLVMIYDVLGRLLATKRDEGGLLRVDVPAAGVYLVKVGDAPAHRVVVYK